jgi:hypothetical protein
VVGQIADDYQHVKLTRKVLEQRQMTYAMAINQALGDGSIRSHNDIASWCLNVILANEGNDAILPAGLGEPPLSPSAEEGGQRIAPSSPTSPMEALSAAEQNQALEESATAGIVRKLRGSTVASFQSNAPEEGRDRSSTLTSTRLSTRARVGSISNTTRQRLNNMSNNNSRSGSERDIVVWLQCVAQRGRSGAKGLMVRGVNAAERSCREAGAAQRFSGSTGSQRRGSGCVGGRGRGG